MLDLKANPDKKAVGTVISRRSTWPRLRLDDSGAESVRFVCRRRVISGTFTGRVKAMSNENGKKVAEAGPRPRRRFWSLNGARQAGAIRPT